MFSESLGHFHTNTTQRGCYIFFFLLSDRMCHAPEQHSRLPNGIVPLVKNTMRTPNVLPIRQK